MTVQQAPLTSESGRARAEETQAVTYLDKGIPRMTPELLQRCCLENRGFESPELNEVLILHYKGFRQIEGLEAYSQVRSLFLECNGLSKIEGLEAMPLLSALYLQSNCIKRIENLEALTCLKVLNLANNNISWVENLDSLAQLEILNLSANKIVDVQALEGLATRPSLRSVDVSCNYIEDGDGLLNFWPQALPKLECLYVHHNTCSRGLKDLRRRLVSQLSKLRWLDDRPVTAVERAGCEAWAIGGKEAELAAKQSFYLHEKEEKQRSFYNFRRMQEAAAARAQAQRQAQLGRAAAHEQVAAEAHRAGQPVGWVAVSGPPPPARTVHITACASSAAVGRPAVELTENSPDTDQPGLEAEAFGDSGLADSDHLAPPARQLDDVSPSAVATADGAMLSGTARISSRGCSPSAGFHASELSQLD